MDDKLRINDLETMLLQKTVDEGKCLEHIKKLEAENASLREELETAQWEAESVSTANQLLSSKVVAFREVAKAGIKLLEHWHDEGCGGIWDSKLADLDYALFAAGCGKEAGDE